MKNPFSWFKVGAKVILIKFSLQQTFWNLNEKKNLELLNK
jgi:hypothetical protein